MDCRCCAVLLLIAGMALASGPWHRQEHWGIRSPKATQFRCPRNLSITAVYSKFNTNTSQRYWKFACGHNSSSINGLKLGFGEWSGVQNGIQQPFSFYCPTNGGLTSIDVSYAGHISDAYFRFGCNKFPFGHHRYHCSVSNSSSLQQEFSVASANDTVIVGVESSFDIGLRDRVWKFWQCKVRKVVCSEPLLPNGTVADYNSLDYGSNITYSCDLRSGYRYSAGQGQSMGICGPNGLWTGSPPACEACPPMKYCSDVLCTQTQLICTACQPTMELGLPVVNVEYQLCQVKLAILSTLPSVVMYNASDQISLHCNAYSYPHKPVIAWYHNGSRLANSSRTLIMLNGTLLLREASAMDEGVYDCIVSNSQPEFASITTELKFRIPELPIIKNWVPVAAFPVGETALLNCEATGHPPPHILWFKNLRPLSHKRRIKILLNGSLVIHKARFNDIGHYQCKARNDVGFVNRVMYVYVHDKINVHKPDNTSVPFAPVIEGWKTLVFVNMYHPITLACKVTGNPVPDIRWKKDGRLIAGAHSPVLIVSINREEDLGFYSCYASNMVGTEVRHVLLEASSSSLPPVTTTVPTQVSVTKASTSEHPTRIPVTSDPGSISSTPRAHGGSVLLTAMNVLTVSFTSLTLLLTLCA